jgi:hypothetical protein
MRLLLILLIAAPCFGQAPTIRRGSAAAGAAIAAGRLNELKGIASGLGTPLYKTDVKMSSREYRKAERFAKEAAMKLVARPRMVKAANISPDRRRVAFKDLDSDVLIAINVRKMPSGEFAVNKAEVLSRDIKATEEWLEKISVFSDEDQFNRNQMITEASHNFKERETWKIVRNPTKTRNLAAVIGKQGVTVSTTEMFAGKVDGKITASYTNPK